MSRHASVIAQEQIQNTHRNKNELSKMKELTDEAYKIIASGKDDFVDFGRLLNETWQLKRKLSSKITTRILMTYMRLPSKAAQLEENCAVQAGGGFIVFYVEPENQKRVKEALSNFLHVPFKFDFSGSEIMVYKPNYYRKQ